MSNYTMPEVFGSSGFYYTCWLVPTWKLQKNSARYGIKPATSGVPWCTRKECKSTFICVLCTIIDRNIFSSLLLCFASQLAAFASGGAWPSVKGAATKNGQGSCSRMSEISWWKSATTTTTTTVGWLLASHKSAHQMHTNCTTTIPYNRKKE